MAVSCHVAFGHYLRTLRERRGLALEEVWTLSQTFPETLNKGYLSRCENGKQKLALPKVVAMSRIYEVPSDVLVERLELDLELEKIGGPATENLSWAQLREAGRNATMHGHRWAAYAFARDATFKVGQSELDDKSYSCHEEQVVGTFINCATLAQGLGKYKYALHEFRVAEQSQALGLDLLTLIADRLASAYEQLGDRARAWEYAELALRRLDESPDRLFEPFVYQLHGLFRLRENRQVDAIPWFHKTYDSFREHGAIKESTQALIGLADCYQETGNHKAASKTLDIAQQICDEHSLAKYKALVLTLQGLIDQDLGRKTAAEEKLREADNIAKELNDRKLRFQVEFYLYKHALANQKPAVARAIKRRLDKLAVSIPDSVEQLAEFRAIQSRISPE